MDGLWQRDPSRKQLRDFGWAVGGALIVLGAILAWRHPDRGIHPALWAIGAVLVVGGTIAPRLLKLPFQVWMAFAFLLGIVMTNVILTVTFLVAFTIVGLLLRLARRDLLELRWSPGAQPSYWRDREEVPIENRHLRPF